LWTGRASFQQVDLTDTGLPGGSADAILGDDAFHFASSIAAAAHEGARLLRPGGKLVITTWGAGRSGLHTADAGADPTHGHQARSDPDALLEIEVNNRPACPRSRPLLDDGHTARSRGGDPAMAALGEEVLKSLPLVTR
jgi:SAM-dependent methyltransferase